MDYEKKYKEALEKARKLYTYPTTKPFISDLQDLFPELKESEDEIVIAALKSGINGLLKKEYHLKGIGGISFDRIIAWLEKQGEQKVEPKFHEEDWVIDNKNRIGVVTRILKEHYIISFDGREEQVPFVQQSQIRPWTIQDAKNGDILHCWIDGDEFILIYKGIKDGYITTYVHLYQKLKFFAKEPTTMFCRTCQGHFTPATKEQREQLEKAMANAGYTFDFEKKKLKKIEQKSTAWSDYDECMLTNLIDDSNCSIDSEYIPWFKSLKDRVQSKL